MFFPFYRHMADMPAPKHMRASHPAAKRQVLKKPFEGLQARKQKIYSGTHIVVCFMSLHIEKVS